MSAESPRHARSGGPLTVPSQPPTDRSIIDAVSGFINDVKLTSSSTVDPKDVIQWARFETADINEPTPEGDGDTEISPLLLILGYGAGVQVWLIPPNGEAQEVLSWRQGTVRVLRILPTPVRGDCFMPKRPLIALCDSASPGPPFCSLSFISIRGGEQVKNIKFKNQILDVLANKRSVVVSFSERFAVFDAGTLEDRMTVTTCYPCPCPLGGASNINPLALGDRWLAYADKKLNQSKRSSGGCEGEGVSSYTATVLHAAKSLGKGLRGLGESVAHSLAGTRAPAPCPSPPALRSDISQPGVVTVIDVEGIEEEDGQDASEPIEPIVAHFIAHSEPVTALKFDASGMLLVTADRRGHDFHVFRINPHPSSPSLASVHHLYVLHRGDTTAKVQDIAISSDSRWAAISTLRGTTHIFAMSPYGGACGVRTHTHPRVVNRLSRFHRSAGLPIHATDKRGPASPVGDGTSIGAWFPNPRLPPYPLPVVNAPLAQLRPTPNLATHTVTRTSSGRQRLSSLSEDSSSVPLLARAQWGAGAGVATGSGGRAPPQAALYLLTAGGALAHLVLHPRAATGVPKEKICDDSPIELEVEPVAQWPLRRPQPAADLLAPLPPSNPLLQPPQCARYADICMSEEERWLSQVEIVTHAGPHRRLWMGPQFVFKTFNCTGSTSSLSEAETVEVEASAGRGVARSNPVNMPGARPQVPVLIDSGSASSLEHSPSDSFRRKSLLAEAGRAASVCDVQLKEDLAEAMKEDHGVARQERSEESEEGVHSVALAVAPGGRVVRAPATQAPPSTDPDDYTCANDDEASFRPVVRAERTLSPPANLPACPLPRTTTIPVQSLQVSHSSRTESDPRPLTTDVVIPAALDLDADLERQMTDASRDHPLPERPDPPVAHIFRKSPTPLVDSSSVTVSVTNVERAVTPEPPVDAETTAMIEDINQVKADNIPPIDVSIKSRRKLPESNTVAAETKKSVSRKLDPAELGLLEFDELKSFKRSSSISKKESSKKSQSKKESSDSLKTDLSRVEPTVTVGQESAPLPSMKDLPVPFKSEPSPALTKKDTSQKKEPVPSKRESSLKKEASKNETPFSDTTMVIASKNEQSSKEESIDPPKRESSPVPLKKEYFPPPSKKESSPLPLKKENRSSKKESKHSSPSPSRKETKKIETLPSVGQKESSPALLKKESSPALLKKETFSEMLSMKRESIDREPSPKKDIADSGSMWKKDKFDWSLKKPTEITESSLKECQEIKVGCGKSVLVKTEEQAWDMLLNQPEKQLSVSPQCVASDKSDDPKPKTKKNRKLKKSQEDAQSKSEDDSFVEIHAIEEKSQMSCGELVSISIPFEELESTSSYSSRTKKSRSPRNFDKKDHETKLDDWSLEDVESTFNVKSYKNKGEYSDNDLLPGSDTKNINRETKWEKVDDPIEIKKSDISVIENIVLKESAHDKKYKSSYENRKSAEKAPETDVKDVYVIDSTQDEFPEIQITRGSKLRKKSFQTDNEEIEKPIKSWSSIAASKNVKKEANKTDSEIKKSDIVEKKVIHSFDDDDIASSSVSLQKELMRVCKRTDIMVAQCDSPSELTFFDEHHTLLEDLPPLELEFNLDDIKLEVMKDSLIEVNEAKVNSPICKIDIDNILSSLKESTSAFNLIDLEKVPVKMEKGFSVIESDTIKSQEVKADDEEKAEEVMEKSSDDDNTSPVMSTDSDKEDKKSNGASNITTPSSKQSKQSKKSRRKKK